MKNFNLIKAIVYILCASVFTSANAALLSFDYTGTIVSSPDAIVPVSTTFSGSFSYEDGISGSSSSTGTLYSPVNFTLSIDSTDISFTGVMNVDNDSTLLLNGFDVVQIGRFGLSPNPNINGTLIEGISIDLTDSTETALVDESLPLSFNLSDWPTNGKFLAIRPLGSSNVTLGRIDTLAPTVPVPAAVWLFGSGLIGLIGVARRKKA